MFHKGEFYPKRDGTPSPYPVGMFKDMTDVNEVIRLMKTLDYPFIAKEWYHYFDIDLRPPNPVGKYINLMNLAAFKRYCFADSKTMNNYEHQELRRLFREAERELYYEVADILPKKEIKTEEIKSNTFKKPKYFIGYDEDNNPFVKFENIKDINMSVDYDTTEYRNSCGTIVGQYTLNKELKIHFTCEEAIFGPIESQEEPKYIVKNETSIEIPKVKEADYELEIDKFIKELNL